MKSYQKVVEKAKEELPRNSSNKPKREKLIRVTDETYLKLSKLGDLTEDYEDVVSKVLRFWEEHHKSGQSN